MFILATKVKKAYSASRIPAASRLLIHFLYLALADSLSSLWNKLLFVSSRPKMVSPRLLSEKVAAITGGLTGIGRVCRSSALPSRDPDVDQQWLHACLSL